jgi:hypothetical protein
VVAVNNNDRSLKLALPKSVSIGVPLIDTRMFSYSQAVSAQVIVTWFTDNTCLSHPGYLDALIIDATCMTG